ncbi:trigger factor [Psychroflexus maritimus]|uniref:Trigger factor n=1 Tax=Psychroflexus maritimus TaxID=2714865 RepID=A0A967E655_9FLAO|nr:trigger factor [Psychroflexus maritimus]NGZ89406.1 trigger factor [Psychroflexus maritimus]
MNITRENKDNLNAVLSVAIAKGDYSEKVEKILKDYRKNANIPGFRKGKVPMGMIKKQYGQAVLVDEVNKLLQDSLNKYIQDEKLDVLGNPLPMPQDNLDWKQDDFTFEFELGLAPEFDVNFDNKEKITHYKITADQEMIDEQIKLIQRQYGKLETRQEVKTGFNVVVEITNQDQAIKNETTLQLKDLAKDAQKSLKGTKIGDSVQLNSKGLFENEEDLGRFLGLEKEDAEALGELDLTFEIKEINEEIPAELNQELFDKYTGEEAKLTSEDELINFIKEQAAEQFVQHSDQQLLNDVSAHLIENTKFELPGQFLTKWIQQTAEKELSDEEAKQEYENSEKGIRYQLIESKIIKENDLKVEPKEMKAMMMDRIKQQMAQYGGANMPDEQLEGFADQMLANQEESRKIAEQVMNAKILEVYKEKLNLKEKEVSFKEFADEAYKQQ